MATDPRRRTVRPSPALIEHAHSLFGPGRGPDGRPSFDDFQALLLPHLIDAMAVIWPTATAVPGFDGLVREVVTQPHVMFGPARVTAIDDGETVWLIGFEPDLDFWAE